MGSITTENPPASVDPELTQYLDRMFRQVNIAMNNADILPIRLDIFTRPKEGKIYYFKSSPPSEPLITSAGYWGFVGDPGTGTWVKLG